MQTTVEAVFAVMKNNAEKAKELLLHVIPKIAAKDWTEIVKGYQVHTSQLLDYIVSSTIFYLNVKWTTAFGILKILNDERNFVKLYSKVQHRKYKVTSVKKKKRLCIFHD